MLVGDKPACEHIARQAKKKDIRSIMTNNTGQMTNSESLFGPLASRPHLSLNHRLKLRIIFLILRELNLNFRLRLPWLAFLEASAREGYGIQECRPVLLGKRQYVAYSYAA
jgi:hypothetical protein